jgi:hypothetical protein
LALQPAGQDPEARVVPGTVRTTAPFADECQSFLDNLIAGFGLSFRYRVARPGASRSARAVAAEKLLDRGYGKPPQVNTVVAGTPRRAADLTDDELAAIVLGVTGAEEQPLLVGRAARQPEDYARNGGQATRPAQRLPPTLSVGCSGLLPRTGQSLDGQQNQQSNKDQ